LAAGICLTTVASAVAETRFLPLAQATVAGGATWYESKRSGIKGLASAEVTPVIEFSDRWVLLPTFRGSYTGNQTAMKVVDEGTLFQQEQKYGGETKLLYRWTPQFKTSCWLGDETVFLKETTDEKWTKGLYDNRTFLFGGDMELIRPSWRWPALFRLGAEYSRVHYPNYTSLASQTGDPLMGARLFDTENTILSFKSLVSPTGRIQWQSTFMGLLASYPDQKVLGEQGDYTEGKRRDWYWTIGQVLSFLHSIGSAEAAYSFGLEGIRRDSNQNYLDSLFLKHLPDYFDYDEGAFSPSVRLRLKPAAMVLEAGVRISRRNYRRRPAQNADGSYASKRMFVRDTTYSVGFSSALVDHVRAFVQGDLETATSNMRYEGFYRYKYNTGSVRTGLTFEF
jgi:hypothetical protein